MRLQRRSSGAQARCLSLNADDYRALINLNNYIMTKTKRVENRQLTLYGQISKMTVMLMALNNLWGYSFPRSAPEPGHGPPRPGFELSLHAFAHPDGLTLFSQRRVEYARVVIRGRLLRKWRCGQTSQESNRNSLCHGDGLRHSWSASSARRPANAEGQRRHNELPTFKSETRPA